MSLKNILGNIGCNLLSSTVPPFGAMASNILRKTLKLDDTATEDDIRASLESATPEQIIALKQAENTFKIDLKKAGIDVKRLENEDTANARKMQMLTKSKMPSLLALFVFAIFGLVSFQVFNIKTDLTMSQSTILAVLQNILMVIVGFYFGSSSSSQNKNELLAKKNNAN